MIRIRKAQGWEKDYGKYVVCDERNMTMESSGSLVDAMRLWFHKVKSYREIERCCR